MSITLFDGTTTLTLPPDLQWVDQYQWAGTEQAVTRSLTGAMIIQTAAKSAGRPITLQPPADNGAWWARSNWGQVQTWLDDPALTLTLTIYATAYTVRFRHHEAPAAEARPVMFFADPADIDWILPSFKFITV